MQLRSTLLGLQLPVRHVSAIQLECPFPQAQQLVARYLQRQGFTFVDIPIPAMSAGFRKPAYCVAYEFYVNEWDEVINQVIRYLHGECAGQDSREPSNQLRPLFSSWLLTCERTVALVQLELAAKSQTKTVMTLQLAWNEHAHCSDTNKAHRFLRGFAARLRQLDIHYHSLPNSLVTSFRQENNTHPPERIAYKLERLEAIRNGSKNSGRVTLSRSQACKEAGIALSTLKRWRPTLHACWSDPTY